MGKTNVPEKAGASGKSTVPEKKASSKSRLQLAQKDSEDAMKRTNAKINELGTLDTPLYSALTEIQTKFDLIRNVPTEIALEYEKVKAIQLNWKQQVDTIEQQYKVSAKVGVGATATTAGVAVAALGPNIAMGIATTFGVASTGTAISALSGAAATNAALAWLGGGALAAGGGGMAAGSLLMSLFGPVGWTIAGVAVVASGLSVFKEVTDKKKVENIYTLISERDTRSYNLATVELSERITRIKDETGKLRQAIETIQTFGTDYSQMSQEQQYELGAYVNLMSASTMLLVNPIQGVQPKYTERDFDAYWKSDASKKDRLSLIQRKTFVINMANMLYKITLDDKDRKLLAKSLRNNKEFLASVGMPKKELDAEDIEVVERALEYKYQTA